MRITADNLRRRAERLREHVPEYGKEAELRETSAALMEQAAAAKGADAALSLVLRAGGMLERADRYWRQVSLPIGETPKPRMKKGELSAAELRALQDRIIGENPVAMNRKTAEARIQSETGLSPRTQRRRLREEITSADDYIRKTYRGPRPKRK